MLDGIDGILPPKPATKKPFRRLSSLGRKLKRLPRVPLFSDFSLDDWSSGVKKKRAPSKVISNLKKPMLLFRPSQTLVKLSSLRGHDISDHWQGPEKSTKLSSSSSSSLGKSTDSSSTRNKIAIEPPRKRTSGSLTGRGYSSRSSKRPKKSNALMSLVSYGDDDDSDSDDDSDDDGQTSTNAGIPDHILKYQKLQQQKQKEAAMQAEAIERQIRDSQEEKGHFWSTKDSKQGQPSRGYSKPRARSRWRK